MLKPRRLKQGLRSMIPSEESKSSELRLVTPSNVQLIATLRTKGGSGEKHLVKALTKELMNQGKRVFVCLEDHIEGDHYLIKHHFSPPTNQLISAERIPTTEGGLVNLNWRIDTYVDELFSIISQERNIAIIFTCNASGAGEMESRTKQLLRFCERVFVSVNGQVEESIRPAKGFSSNPSIDQDKLKYCWWHEKNRDEEKDYYLGLFDSIEFRENTIVVLNQKTQRLENVKFNFSSSK